MDMYMFGHWPMPMQGCCEAVGTTAINSRYDLDISASPEPTPAKAGFPPAHLLRLVTKGNGNADLCSGGRPAAHSFSSSVSTAPGEEKGLHGSLIRFVQHV